jgi:hypothetical protein
MFHTIEFTVQTFVDLEISRNDRLELIIIQKGSRCQAQVKPYVVETQDGPVEVADLFFDDGTSISRLPFRCFAFVDE